MSRKKIWQSGFTLIELLVVLMIIGLLAALVGPRFIQQGEKGKITSVKAQIALFDSALDMFKLDVGRYPNAQEGLQALRERPAGVERWDGPYLKKEIPKDPWAHSYVYRVPGENGPYDILSYGADGVAGGDGEAQDIGS